MENHDPLTTNTESKRRRIRSGLVASGLAAGLALAGLGVAAAQEVPSTNEDAPAPTSEAAPPMLHRGPGGGHGGGRHGHGLGMGAIHGEFTTPGPNDGYQTIATQSGEVTKVSASSITVKSVDGFERTYSVSEDTLVNSGRDGIADVKAGDTVRITATVSGDKASAVELDDVTNMARLGGQWRPRPPAPVAPSGTPS